MTAAGTARANLATAREGVTVRRVILAGLFAAVAVVLSTVGAIPIGPTKILPFQHMVNAVAGVLLGPWWAAASALVAAAVRNLLGIGTVFAFPGSPFGAVVVGLAYRAVRRDWAALLEPLGTGPIGATLAALVVAPLAGHALGWATLQYLFLASSIPGAILGFVALKALRAAGLRDPAAAFPAGPGAAVERKGAGG